MTKTTKGNSTKVETTQAYLKDAQRKGKNSSIKTTHMYIEKVKSL